MSHHIIRPIEDFEMQDAVALVDQVFRQGNKVSMGVTLPKAFSPSLKQSIGCFVDGKLVSFAGMIPSKIRIGAASLTVYSYGAVCTDPNFRGRGLAKEVLEYAKQHAERSGASLLLVSGELPLYTEAGCYPFGRVERFAMYPNHVEQLQPLFWGGFKYREATLADFFYLHELAAAREVRYEQSIWDMADLMHAQAIATIYQMQHRTFIAEQGGKPVAFCIIGVSNQRTDGAIGGFAIEWAGADEAVMSLLLWIHQELGLRKLEIVVPWQDVRLLSLLEPALVQTEANQGTIYIVNTERLIAQLEPYWLEKGDDPSASPAIVTQTEDTVTLSTGRYTTPPLNRKELQSLVFGYQQEGETHDRFLKEMLKPYLPIPFPSTIGLNFA